MIRLGEQVVATQYTAEVRGEQAADDLGALLPVSQDQVIAAGLMFVIGAIGGAVSFWQRRLASELRPFRISELVGELCVSGFVGIGTFWVMAGLHVNSWLTAAAVGICGHMGTRVIFLAEKWIERRLRQPFEYDKDKPDRRQRQRKTKPTQQTEDTE